MNKVKPQAGQVWRDTRASGEAVNITGVFEIDGDSIVDIEIHRQFIERDSYYVDCFMKLFEFIPQNDLEWLAVNVDEWPKGGNFFVRKAVTYREFNTIGGQGFYSLGKWQNMRYKLGLDEKPRITAKEWARMLKSKAENNDYLNGVFN